MKFHGLAHGALGFFGGCAGGDAAGEVGGVGGEAGGGGFEDDEIAHRCGPFRRPWAARPA